MSDDPLGTFGRWLSVWVASAIVAGVVLGRLVPSIPDTLSREHEHAKLQSNHHGQARSQPLTIQPMLGQTQQSLQWTKHRSKDLGEKEKWQEKDKTVARR